MFKRIFNKEEEKNQEDEYSKWLKDGKPVPPPHIVKQKMIQQYREEYSCKILVETGTYLGEMINAQLQHFEKIFSIELSKKLYKKAKSRFKDFHKVEILHGDSGKKLEELVPKLNARTLFWLDGHYSGGMTALGDKECPVVEELRTILHSDPSSIILIDDARLFNGTHDYPTIEEIRNMMPGYEMKVEDDVIKLTPQHN